MLLSCLSPNFSLVLTGNETAIVTEEAAAPPSCGMFTQYDFFPPTHPFSSVNKSPPIYKIAFSTIISGGANVSFSPLSSNESIFGKKNHPAAVDSAA